MAATTLTPEDLAPFATIDEAKAEAMIEDALGQAKLLAPCIFDEAFENEAAAKAVLRSAVLRWNESGQGALTQLTALGFGQSFDTRQNHQGLFRPTEISLLQSMCATNAGGAYAIDTAPYAAVVHAETCALVFGATYCDCGADIAYYPLYETP